MKAAGFLAVVCGLLSAAQTITPLSDRVDGLSSPALSPDGRTLAYDAVGRDYSTWIDVRPFSGGKAVHFSGWRDEGAPISPRWSPNGEQIAFLRYYCHSCNLKLFLKDFPNGPEKLLGEVCGGAPSWTPDGRFLVATELAGKYAGWDPCRVVLIPLDGGARVDANYRFAGAPVEIAKEPHAIYSLHWSADGRTLVYQVWNYKKAVTGGVARLIQTGALIGISQILADGSALGTEDRGPSALWRVDLKAARLEPEKVRSIPWTNEDLSVSPDGRRLAFATARNGPTQIWVSRMDGSNARVLIPAIPPFDQYGDKTTVDGVSWSPDGKLIALETQPGTGHGDSRGRIFVVPSAGERLRKVVDCGSIGRAPVWAADGESLYTLTEDYKSGYFLADIANGSLTPIAEDRVPKFPLVPLPDGSGQPHVAQGGRFLYYEAPVNRKPRLVKVEGLVPR